MSNIVELKRAVRDILNLSLNLTDSFQGEANSDDVDSVIDTSILRAANNARLWAERQHDFAENDMAVRLYYKSGLPALMIGVDDRIVGGQSQAWYGCEISMTSTTAGKLRSYYVGETTNGGTAVLQNIHDYDDASQITTADSSGDLITFTGASIAHTSRTKTRRYAFSVNTALGSREPLHHLKTLKNAYLVESGGGYRPIWIKSRKTLVTQARRHLDLEDIDPYYRYPATDPTETQPVYLTYDGVNVRVMPEQDATVVLEGNRWMAPYEDDEDTDFLLQDGFDFMMWATIVELNHLNQKFVPRQEGSLPPPVHARDEAWMSLVAHDEFRYDGNIDYDM